MAADKPDLTRLTIDRAPTPARRRGAGRWIAGAIVLALLAWLGWPALAARFDGRPEVRVARAQRVTAAAALTGTAANGYVVARRQAALSTDVQGRLVELKVEEGDRVQAGDLIARLDTRALEALRGRARGELTASRSALEIAQLDHARKAALLPAGDIAQAEVDLARTTLDGARARAAAYEAAVAEIEVQISKSSVFAPFDGVITAKNAEIGEVVSSIASGGNSRGSVATLVDFDTLEVQVELAQTSLRAARDGAPVTIFLDALPDRAWPGRVRQIWPTADRQKATVELRCEFLERDERILPEMSVRVVFSEGAAGGEPVEPHVLVPRAALSGDAVWVLADGRVTRRAVTTAGEGPRDTVKVVDGLSGSEQVVLDPPAGLEDGDEVRLAEARP